MFSRLCHRYSSYNTVNQADLNYNICCQSLSWSRMKNGAKLPVMLHTRLLYMLSIRAPNPQMCSYKSIRAVKPCVSPSSYLTTELMGWVIDLWPCSSCHVSTATKGHVLSWTYHHTPYAPIVQAVTTVETCAPVHNLAWTEVWFAYDGFQRFRSK